MRWIWLHIIFLVITDSQERAVVTKNMHKLVQDKVLKQTEKPVKIANKHKRTVKFN